MGTNPAPCPLAPTNLTATLQTGPQVTLAWRDNATNETGFVVERCGFAPTAPPCSNFAPIAVAPARNNTGNTSSLDATPTVVPGNSYLYRVAAVNASSSASVHVRDTWRAPIAVPTLPARPDGLPGRGGKKANGKNYTATLTWTDNAAGNETGFTIQRATNLQVHDGANHHDERGSHLAGTGPMSVTQTVTSNTTYY